MLKTDNVPGLGAAWGTLTHTEQLGGGTQCEEPKQRGRAARQVLREGLPNEAMLEHPREQSCRSRKGSALLAFGRTVKALRLQTLPFAFTLQLCK